MVGRTQLRGKQTTRIGAGAARKGRGSRGGNQVKMTEVASSAGVSTITVSRALSRPELVAPETRKKIDRAIRNLGYVPNMVAGTLASQRSSLIAVIVPNISNSVFAETLQGMSEVLRSAGYHLLIGHSGYSLVEEESLINKFLARRPDGIVLTGYSHRPRAVKMIKQAGIPVVEMWNLTRRPIDTIVGFSNFDAAYAMTAYLARKGHRRFGYIGGLIEDNDRTREREAGFDAAMKDLGIPFDPSHRIRVPFEFSAGSEAIAELLARAPDLDVVFAAGDILAVGVVIECQRRGMKIPDQLAVAGFDDAPLASLLPPGLTTVRIPRYQIGRVVAERLLSQLAGARHGERVVDLGFEIIERGTA